MCWCGSAQPCIHATGSNGTSVVSLRYCLQHMKVPAVWTKLPAADPWRALPARGGALTACDRALPPCPSWLPGVMCRAGGCH
jgi:hypothetical protein